MWLATAAVAAIGAGVITIAVWLRREMPDVITRPRLLTGVGLVALALVGLGVVTVMEVAGG